MRILRSLSRQESMDYVPFTCKCKCLSRTIKTRKSIPNVCVVLRSLLYPPIFFFKKVVTVRILRIKALLTNTFYDKCLHVYLRRNFHLTSNITLSNRNIPCLATFDKPFLLIEQRVGRAEGETGKGSHLSFGK